MNPSAKISPLIDLQLFEAMPGNSALLLPNTPTYTIAAVTDGYIDIAGRNKEELISSGLFEAFPNTPDDAEKTSEHRLRASLEHALLKKQSHRLPLHRYDIPNADGSFDERYWSTINKPVINESGEVLYIIHSAEDVTHQVKAEQRANRIKDLEKSYNLFMQAPVTIGVVKGSDFTIEMANDTLLEVWGRSAEVIGKPLFEAIHELNGQGFQELLEGVLQTGESYHAYEHPIRLIRHGREEVLYFDFVYKPYYEEGVDRPVGVLAVGHDITKQVEARQKFKNVMEQAKDPILILMGEELILDTANQALFDLWRVGPDALQKPFLEILPEMKNQGFVELLKDVLHTGKPFFGKEVPAIFERKSGSKETVYFDFSYQPYRQADGSIAGVLVMATDITEQVVARQRLLESERNLRNTILQSPVAMCIFRGPSFVVEIANNRMFDFWGKPGDAFLGKPIFDGLPEAKGQGFEQLLHHVYTTGETVSASEATVTLPRKTGIETVYVNFVYEPFREGDGEISGVIAVAIDVTEQVLARRKVEESSKQFSTLANSIGQLAWIANADGWIHWYNDRWYEYTGTTLEEMKGWGWEKVHHPDHIDCVVAFVKNAWQKGEPWELTFPLRRQDGTYRWFLTRAVPVKDAEENVVQWIGTNTDIDEQKTIETVLEEKIRVRTQELESQRNLLNNILVNSSNGISVTEMIKDSNGDVIDAITIVANDAAVKNTGLSREVYLTKRATELDPNVLRSQYGQMCLGTLKTGEPSFSQYYLEVSGRWLELTISKMDDDHLIHIFTDVTPIKETQLQLERSLEDLRLTNRNLEEFAYAASHDLKEPIRKVHFFSDRLKNELQNLLNDNQKRLFERLQNASKRMGSLVDDLLAYSQSTKGAANKEDVDLNQKVQLVLDDLELELQQRAARIHVANLPRVAGDKRQFQQLFQNLITNALKYSKPNVEPEVNINYREVVGREAKTDLPHEEYNRSFHLIEIQDNGIGFEQKDAERIFHVFTRLHTNTEFRGTGVGLSIAQRVVQNHNGYIWAESAPGQGATFKILLPVHQ